ncbi:MAG: hypothetical protein S0880_24830 [Actinomycetota bacterium]|nr:hypothetical protein [Actinomycetota bacterium]
MNASQRARVCLAAAIVGLAVAGSIGYVVLVDHRVGGLAVDAPAPDAAAMDERRAVVYVSEARDHPSALAVWNGDGPPTVTDRRCDRVHAAGSRAVCVRGDGAVTGSIDAAVLDENLVEVLSFGGAGRPSRARVATDGRRVAYTTFVEGHSYLDEGGFSTVTAIVDVPSGLHTNLEAYTLVRDGRPWSPTDVNFWGVTFAPDSDRFWATVSSGGRTWLVEGDAPERRLEVVAADAECPSASPDGSRLVYKQRRPGGFGRPDEFVLVVHDVATGERHRLEAAGHVDDQVEWLDDDTILFGRIGTDGRSTVWSLDLDDPDGARPFLRDASSPAVVSAGSFTPRPEPSP